MLFFLQDKPEEQPAPIIHRNFDDCYNGGSAVSLGNPLAMIQNFNIPLPSLSELVGETPPVKLVSQKDVPLYAGHSMHNGHSRKTKVGIERDSEKRET